MEDFALSFSIFFVGSFHPEQGISDAAQLHSRIQPKRGLTEELSVFLDKSTEIEEFYGVFIQMY